MITRTLLVFPCLFLSSFAFVGKSQQQQHFHTKAPQRLHPKQLHLIPLSNYDDSISFFSEPDSYRCCIDNKGFFSASNDNDDDSNDNASISSQFQLGVLQEDELPDLCRFVVSAFGAEAISLSSDMTSFEKALMNPAAELLNGYSSLVAFAEGKKTTTTTILYACNNTCQMLVFGFGEQCAYSGISQRFCLLMFSFLFLHISTKTVVSKQSFREPNNGLPTD